VELVWLAHPPISFLTQDAWVQNCSALGVNYNALPFIAQAIRHFNDEKEIIKFLQRLQRLNLLPTNDQDNKIALEQALLQGYQEVIKELIKQPTIRQIAQQIDPNKWQEHLQTQIVHATKPRSEHIIYNVKAIISWVVDNNLPIDFNKIEIPSWLGGKRPLLTYLYNSLSSDYYINKNVIGCIMHMMGKMDPSQDQLNKALKVLLQNPRYNDDRDGYIAQIHALLQMGARPEAHIHLISQRLAYLIENSLFERMYSSKKPILSPQLIELVLQILTLENTLATQGQKVVPLVVHFISHHLHKGKYLDLERLKFFIPWAKENNIPFNYNLAASPAGQTEHTVLDQVINVMAPLLKAGHSVWAYREVIKQLNQVGATLIHDLTQYKKVILESGLSKIQNARRMLEEVKHIVEFTSSLKNTPQLQISITELKTGSLSLLEWALQQIKNNDPDLPALFTYLLTTAFGKVEHRELVQQTYAQALSSSVIYKGKKQENAANAALAAITPYVDPIWLEGKQAVSQSLEEHVLAFINAFTSQLYTISENNASQMIEDVKKRFTETMTEAMSERKKALKFLSKKANEWLQHVIQTHKKGTQNGELIRSEVLIPIIDNHLFFQLSCHEIAGVLCQLVAWDDQALTRRLLDVLPADMQKKVLASNKHEESDFKGKTALQIAQERGYKAMHKLLYHEYLIKLDPKRPLVIAEREQQMEQAGDTLAESVL